ncbi:phage holin family protein [Candidatus Saccharibacteria bacterium]|nr:phage holin family protein [Candidatus Saccharibacteria bacterium]
MIKRFLFTWLANFIGLLLGSIFLSGINASGLWVVLIASLLFGIINALLKPVLVILSLPFIVITFGLFSLLINASLLYITSAIYKPFHVTSIGAAVAAVIVVWLANYIMSFIIDREKL